MGVSDNSIPGQGDMLCKGMEVGNDTVPTLRFWSLALRKRSQWSSGRTRSSVRTMHHELTPPVQLEA